MANAFDFTFRTLANEEFPLRALAGRPFLVVNTASKCGFTPQYKGLETLWREFKAQGLTVIGVPCNDFGGQEPGSSEEIRSFCETHYGVDFPIMAKEHAKGGAAHPFFTWVGAEAGFLARPRWNFFKYLVGEDGRLATWFSCLTRPESRRLRSAVEKTLAR